MFCCLSSDLCGGLFAMKHAAAECALFYKTPPEVLLCMREAFSDQTMEDQAVDFFNTLTEDDHSQQIQEV